MVLAIETGGRWSEEAVDVFHKHALARACDVPSCMFKQVALAWERRWTRMLATTCAIAFAASLVAPVSQCDMFLTGGEAPDLSDMLADPR